MSVESAEQKFWEALSHLMRDDDYRHNAALVADFSKVSGIPEETVWQRLRERLHERIKKVVVHCVPGTGAVN